MGDLISKAELARRAGVSKPAVTKATAGPLADAMVGTKVDSGHPLIVEWLASHGAQPVKAQSKKPASTKKPRKSASTAKKPSTVGKPDKKPAQSSNDQPLPSSYPTEIGGYAVEDLEELTIREVLMRHGSIDGFKRVVESMKHIADYKAKELLVQQRRGKLIDRDLVAGAVFPLIDVAFARLVSDIPVSITQLIIARVESGGDDTVADVQKIIRDANSKALKNAKTSITKMEILKDAS